MHLLWSSLYSTLAHFTAFAQSWGFILSVENLKLMIFLCDQDQDGEDGDIYESVVTISEVGAGSAFQWTVLWEHYQIGSLDQSSLSLWSLLFSLSETSFSCSHFISICHEKISNFLFHKKWPKILRQFWFYNFYWLPLEQKHSLTESKIKFDTP